MKILELKAQNVLNLKAVEIKPDGDSVVLTGDNEAGKSSVLNSIFMALAGHKVDEPIRKGQERGEVMVNLGDIIVKKVFTQKGERLEVSNPDGAIYKSPQTLLNELLGKLSFNPIEFSDLSKTAEGRRKQREILMNLASLDLTELDERKEGILTERAEVNRTLRKDKAEMGEMKIPPVDGLPDEEISMTEEVEKLEALRGKRAEYLEVINKKADYQENIKEKHDEIQAIDKEIMRLAEKKECLAQKIEELSRESANIPIPREVTENEIDQAKVALSQVEEKNRQIRYAKEYQSLAADIAENEIVVERLTKQVEEVDKEKAAIIQGAEYPIEGLGVDEDGVIFDGIPFSQNSTARQLVIATSICMALNPKLRVILLRDASVLGKKNLEAICQMAAEKDYQVWIEKVDDSGKVGIFIEDGEIVAVNGEPVKQEVEGNG